MLWTVRGMACQNALGLLVVEGAEAVSGISAVAGAAGYAQAIHFYLCAVDDGLRHFAESVGAFDPYRILVAAKAVEGGEEMSAQFRYQYVVVIGAH